MSERTVAERLFEATNLEAGIEEEVLDALATAKIPCGGIWWDYYDSSLEITKCPDALTAEQQDAIYALGFKKFWTHSKGKGETRSAGNVERGYSSYNKETGMWDGRSMHVRVFSGCAMCDGQVYPVVPHTCGKDGVG